MCVGILKEQYVNLSTKLDAQAAAVHMYQRNALTLKELQSIQCLRDRPVKAAETLLNTIMAQPDVFYLCFLDVLKHTEQQHIYEMLVKGGYKGEWLPLNAYLTVYRNLSNATAIAEVYGSPKGTSGKNFSIISGSDHEILSCTPQ